MRRYFVFGLVSMVLLLSSINATSVSVAFPVITSRLDTSLVVAGWVLSVYQLTTISAMPLAAKLSDVIGRKPTFMLSALLFTLGSVMCAVSSSIGFLIFSRVIQAAGGGGFLPTAAGIVSEEFPEARQRAIGLFTSVFPAGAIIGPNLGGWLVSSFGWESVFWFNVPLGALAVFCSSWLLRGSTAKSGAGIDFLGAGMLVGFISAFMLSLTQLGNIRSGGSWVLIGLLLVLSVVLGFAFVRRERGRREAIISIEILWRRPFLSANLYNIIYGACAFGVFSLMPLFAMTVYGASELESGLILTPRSVGMMAASLVISLYLTRWGYRRPILVGTAIIILSLVLLAAGYRGGTPGLAMSPLTWLVVVIALSGIGVGISAPAANNACIELMPDKVATITSLRGMFRQMGGALCITVATLLMESLGDIALAFGITFISLAALLLLAVPAVFRLPESPETKNSGVLGQK
ncbi:MAG: MFS transporter [Chloroflexi bacterium]|nr:MFS transporter [Chloroflexota bacterium]